MEEQFSENNDDSDIKPLQSKRVHSLNTRQQDQIKNMFAAWSDLVQLPSIGPFQAFLKDSLFYSQELFNIGQALIQLQLNLNSYWIQVNNAYGMAVEEISEKTSKKQHNHNDSNNNSKADIKNYRNIAIDAFEDSFTALFNSKEFGVIYAKVLSNQLDLLKHFQNIAEQNSKALNLPTRSEVDEIIKDIHELKRAVRDIKRKVGTLQ
jgi:hypothetical protein